MTRRGRRSRGAEQRRFLVRLISREAYRDPAKAESINIYTTKQLEHLLEKQFGRIVTPRFLRYEQGEVISDPKGRGSFQTHEEDD